MKTLLLWGVSDGLSQHVAHRLSAEGHRLLLTGAELNKLQDLDSLLCQSELHRYADAAAPRRVAQWVEEQRLGLDGVVLFPSTPEPVGSLLVPMSANLRHVQAGFFESLELVRELMPQLRRGKRPKRLVVVLPWNDATRTTCPQLHLLVNLWQSNLAPLSAELDRDQILVNVVSVAPKGCDALVSDEGYGLAHATTSAAEEERDPRAAIESCPSAAFVAAWFSPALAHLTGHFIAHPEHLGSRFAEKKKL